MDTIHNPDIRQATEVGINHGPAILTYKVGMLSFHTKGHQIIVLLVLRRFKEHHGALFVLGNLGKAQEIPSFEVRAHFPGLQVFFLFIGTIGIDF